MKTGTQVVATTVRTHTRAWTRTGRGLGTIHDHLTQLASHSFVHAARRTLGNKCPGEWWNAAPLPTVAGARTRQVWNSAIRSGTPRPRRSPRRYKPDRAAKLDQWNYAVTMAPMEFHGGYKFQIYQTASNLAERRGGGRLMKSGTEQIR